MFLSFLQNLFWPHRNPANIGWALPPARRREAFLTKLEGSGFNGWVFFVAASGFFTDSYNLFASNVVLPALAFVYWDTTAHKNQLAFNIITLAFSALGQLVFGVAADVFGRRSLYGQSTGMRDNPVYDRDQSSTIGLLQCSQGWTNTETGHSTWAITPWLLFWRAIMGFGIGAEYPLSACIAAEWSSTSSRPRMMSAVFLMQPLGQLCAYAAGLTWLHSVGPGTGDIDALWRYVIGIGAIPTLLAILFRLSIPESGRFTYDVLSNAAQADTDTAKVYPGEKDDEDSDEDGRQIGDYRSAIRNFRLPELTKYLITEENWVYLLGTSLTWFLLDFAFYGMGFNNPALIAKIWSSEDFHRRNDAPLWLVASSVRNNTAPYQSDNALIREVLHSNMTHAIYTVCLASITGCMLITALINRVERKVMLILTFWALAILLLITFAGFDSLFHQEQTHVVLIVFWVAISFLYSFGPNTLTWIFPAELFATKYRCTLYGVAAASGKLGSVLVQIVILANSSIEDPNSSAIKWLLLSFAVCMLLGGAVAALCLPSVQYRSLNPPHRKENLSLESLAVGRRELRKAARTAQDTQVELMPRRAE